MDRVLEADQLSHGSCEIIPAEASADLFSIGTGQAEVDPHDLKEVDLNAIIDEEGDSSGDSDLDFASFVTRYSSFVNYKIPGYEVPMKVEAQRDVAQENSSGLPIDSSLDSSINSSLDSSLDSSSDSSLSSDWAFASINSSSWPPDPRRDSAAYLAYAFDMICSVCTAPLAHQRWTTNIGSRRIPS